MPTKPPTVASISAHPPLLTQPAAAVVLAAFAIYAVDPREFLHISAQVGDIVSAVAAIALTYLTYRLVRMTSRQEIELVKLQLDGPPSACLVRTTGRAEESSNLLED